MVTDHPTQWESPDASPAAESAAAPPAIAYGGFWRRFVAYMADSLILGLLFVPVAVPLVLDPGGILWVILLVVVALLGIAYFPFFWARTGSTPAMAALGLRVVRADDGRVISVLRAIGRYLGFALATIPLYIGLIWAAFEPRKRGWHDMLAGTVVIRIPEASKGKRVATYVAAALGLVAILVVPTAVAFFVTLASLTAEVGQDAPGFDAGAPIAAPTTMAFTDLRIGHCFNPTADFLEVSVEGVPCDDPHIYELVAVRELPAGEYPATIAAQDELATSACQQSVLQYVGLSRADDVYISYIGLFEADWQAGDRRVWCIVHNEGVTPVEGSAQDGWR